MIEKEGKKLILECDSCSSYVEDFFDFQEIIDYKKNNGWKNYRVEKMWVDVCPNCVSKFNNQTRWKYGK